VPEKSILLSWAVLNWSVSPTDMEMYPFRAVDQFPLRYSASSTDWEYRRVQVQQRKRDLAGDCENWKSRLFSAFQFLTIRDDMAISREDRVTAIFQPARFRQLIRKCTGCERTPAAQHACTQYNAIRLKSHKKHDQSEVT
jgi:hypothetical protein